MPSGGTSGIYARNPLERHFRDVQVLHHHGFAAEGRYETVGQVMLGAPPELGFVAFWRRPRAHTPSRAPSTEGILQPGGDAVLMPLPFAIVMSLTALGLPLFDPVPEDECAGLDPHSLTISIDIEKCIPDCGLPCMGYDSSLTPEWSSGSAFGPCVLVGADGHAIVNTWRCIDTYIGDDAPHPTAWTLQGTTLLISA